MHSSFFIFACNSSEEGIANTKLSSHAQNNQNSAHKFLTTQTQTHQTQTYNKTVDLTGDMKFCTLTIAAAALLKKANSQTVTNNNFQLVGSYSFPSDLGAELGGGSIVGNTLYLVVNSERADSYIASVPVERDPDTDRITGFDFAGLQDIHSEEYLEQLSQLAKFPDSTNPQTPRYVFTNTDDDNYPFTISFASSDPAFTSITRIENIPSLNIFDEGTGDQFLGCFGVDFSPVITDPGTGIGKLMCTSTYSFWEVGLQPKTDGNANEWEISGVTKLADLDAEWSGGYSFIPSSSLKDNIFFADWDNGIVKMMKFGTDGLPLGTVDAPEVYDFITPADGQSPSDFYPWGFFFDEATNDFFVSTWDRNGGDGILQFKGFVPGLNIDVVTENIKNELNIALDIHFGAVEDVRRKLQAKPESEFKYFRGHSQSQSRRNLNEAQGEDHRADPCEKANSNAAHGLEIAAEKCKKETVIPPAEEIANEILTVAEDADEATDYFVSLLDETFTNDSYETTVLEGGTSEKFDNNLIQISDSVDEIKKAVDSADIADDKKAEAQASLDKVNYFLALLANVVEGKGA